MATSSQAGSIGALRRYLFLLPAAVGIGFAYVGLPIATSLGFCGSQNGPFADGAVMAALGVLLLGAMAFRRARIELRPPVVSGVFLTAALLEFAGVLSLGLLRLVGACTPEAWFWLSVGVTMAGVVAIACWLREMRAVDALESAVLVFAAMAASAVPSLAVDLLPESIRCLVLAPVVLAQVPLFFWESAKIAERDSSELIRDDDYRAFLLSGSANKRFLVAGAVGLVVTALVSGFLCGFSDEESIVFGREELVARVLLVEAVCAVFIAAVLRGKRRIMTVGVWITAELLAGVALVLYTAFPDHLAIGAVAATVLGAVMAVIVWHLSLAFMAAGWREPLYYAILIWAIWAISHGVGRYGLTLLPMHGDSHFTGTVISLLLLVSTQIIMVKLIDVTRYAVEVNAQRRVRASGGEGEPSLAADGSFSEDEDAAPSALERLLGLDDDSSIPDVRHAVMRRSAEEIGRQFMLSDREVEVLSLYAAGFTQKRVAAELHVTLATAHTHISRIYAKTGMHSRQELLDYMSNYIDGEEIR